MTTNPRLLGRHSLEWLWQDIRYALRGMGRSPAFTAVAIVSLALGIGATTAIFSLISTLILRPLPVSQPQRLVEFLNLYPGDPPLNVFSWASYQHFRDNNRVFSETTGVAVARFNMRGEGLEPEVVDGESVVGNFFPMLGLQPAVGRLIAPEDDRVGDPRSAVAVVSWSYWQNRFSLTPAVLGKRIVVENVPVTVIGVAPREFSGMRAGVHTDVWVPSAVDAIIHPNSRQGGGAMAVVARMKDGVSLEQARAEMAVLFQWTLEERIRGSKNPRMRELKFEVQPAGRGLSTELRGHFEKPLLALMAIVTLLLLIACTNVASMMLARGASRQREMAVRLSLGAGRWRLVRLVLTEALLLSGAGALCGIFVAWFGATGLVRIIQSGRPIIGVPHISIQVNPDSYVLLFTAAVALLTGVLFGLAPAWSAFRSAPAGSLQGAAKGTETKFRRVFGKGLVMAQVALSVGLLTAAGLFVSHLSNLKQVDLGFRQDHVLLVRLDRSRSGYSPAQLTQAYRELLARLRTIPGIRSATICSPSPLSGAGASQLVTVQGHPERPEDRRYISVSWIAPKYFETLGTPLLEGRDFTFEDRARTRVAIVNQAMARYYFPNADPIGKSIAFDGDAVPYEIVGVSGDAKYYEISEAAPRTIYLNTFQSPQPASELAIRTSVEPTAVGTAVRGTVYDLLKTVPIVKVTSLEDQVEGSIVPERLIATLSGLFGTLGSLLAALGIYGLLAYTVARRTNEIGIRMALGATQHLVFRMVLTEALTLSCGGLLFGVPITYWGKRIAGRLIQDLPAASSVPLIFGAATTIAVALLAASLPARRASRVDPMEALRYE
jgi:putative ABC transport system permease protein